MNRRPVNTRKALAWAQVAGLLLALVVAAWLLWLLVQPMVGAVSREALEAWVQSAGLWAPVVSVALMVLHTLIPFPAELLAAANGIVFGAAKGTVITWLGGLAGAASGYAVGALFHAWLLRRPGYAELLEKARHVVERHGTAGLVLVRLLPVIPFNLIDYAAGALRLSWWSFGWTTAVGILPWAALLSIGGTHVLRALHGEAGAVALVAGIAILLAAAIWVGHRVRRSSMPGVRSEVPRVVAGPDTEPDTARFTVRDMACGLCARRLTAALYAEPGVRGVQVVLERQEICVHFDRRRTGLDHLMRTVGNQGFIAEVPVAPAAAGP